MKARRPRVPHKPTDTTGLSQIDAGYYDPSVPVLAHEPFGHRPTMLLVRIRRYKWAGCGRSWREDLTAAAPERAKLSRGGTRWARVALMIDHLTVSRIAAGLGVSWHTANDTVLAEGRRVLIDDPGRIDGVRVVGVDEHV